MPNRDYAARSNKSSGKSSVNKLLILVIVLLLLGMSALALMLLKSKEPVSLPVTQPAATQQPKSELPTPPAEIYSYIRDLETREVPIDKNTRTVQLTREQELQLQQQKEDELRKQELVNQQLAQQQIGQQSMNQTQDESIVNETQPEVKVIKALTPEELAAKKAEEEKRKLAEQQRQQAPRVTAKTQESVQAKVVAKPTNEAPKAVGKFGLQCGAFKNKAQAENMQARLAMAGYNARIASSGEWNRVFVGPVGDRAAASKAQANARSVAECMIVGM